MTLDISPRLIEQVRDIAVRAGQEIMAVYNSDFEVDAKDDKSPVTEADRRAETLITDAIRSEITDAIPIVGEEAVAEGRIPNVSDDPFWLVDPLDGTKEFIRRRTEFTVNIALIEAGLPVLGVVHLPATGDVYWGSSHGAFATTGGSAPQSIGCRPTPADGLIAIVSRSHRSPEIDDYLSQFKISTEVSAGSSMKFCHVATGAADLYPRLGRTMEWDTAAGHAVLRFAGGSVKTLEGDELRYGKPEFENPHFVARSDRD